MLGLGLARCSAVAAVADFQKGRQTMSESSKQNVELGSSEDDFIPEAKNRHGETDGGEPRNGSSRGRTAAVCSHEQARLEHRFCPSCGENLPVLPHAAIEEIVEAVLVRHGIESPSSEPKPKTKAKSRSLFENLTNL